MGEFTDSMGPGGGKRSVRDVALGRRKMAADNLRKNSGSNALADAGYGNLAAPPAPEEASHPRGLIGSVLDRGNAAAAPQPEVPALAEGEGGMAAPPPDPYQQVSTGALGYGGALQNAMDLDRSYRTVRRGNQMYVPTQQYIGESKENMLAKQDAMDERFMTEASMARDAAAMADEAHQIQAQTAARQQVLAANEARRRVEIDQDIQGYRQAIDKASAEFQKAEKYDPGAAWADKSAGQKARIMLAALGRGLQGGNPQEVFNDVLQRELAAHKQMRSDAGEALGAARSDMSNAMVERDSFLALAQDERLADAMLEASTMKKLQAKMRAMEAEYGPRIVTDQWKEASAVADQMATDADYRMAQLAASQPRYFYSRQSTMGANERRIRQKMGDQMIDTAGEAQKQGISAMAEQQQREARDSYGLTDRDWKQVEKYGSDENVAKMEGVNRLIDSITAPTDIKGVGTWDKKLWGDEPRDLNSKLLVLKNALGRAESGGAITEDELTMFTDMIESGVSMGGGEERLRKNLGEVRRMMDARLETKRRSMSQAARDYYDRQNNPDYVGEAQRSGMGRKRVQAADGSITVNRSEFE